MDWRTFLVDMSISPLLGEHITSPTDGHALIIITSNYISIHPSIQISIYYYHLCMILLTCKSRYLLMSLQIMMMMTMIMTHSIRYRTKIISMDGSAIKDDVSSCSRLSVRTAAIIHNEMLCPERRIPVHFRRLVHHRSSHTAARDGRSQLIVS